MDSLICWAIPLIGTIVDDDDVPPGNRPGNSERKSVYLLHSSITISFADSLRLLSCKSFGKIRGGLRVDIEFDDEFGDDD